MLSIKDKESRTSASGSLSFIILRTMSHIVTGLVDRLCLCGRRMYPDWSLSRVPNTVTSDIPGVSSGISIRIRWSWSPGFPVW